MPARYETIAKLANEFGWTKGAELGVFDGRTHVYLLENCPQLHMIGVDVWDTPGFSEGPTKSGERCICQYCNETRLARRRRSIGQMRADLFAAPHLRSTLIVGETVEVAKEIEDGSLDFVFVDGDHSTEGVSADILAWRQKVRNGGILIGHDWNMASVRNAVLQHFDESQVFLNDDHLWSVVL